VTTLIRNTTRTAPLSIQERLTAAKTLQDLTSTTAHLWAATDFAQLPRDQVIQWIADNGSDPDWQVMNAGINAVAATIARRTRRPEFDQIGVGE
jgi:hypothetical protein